MSRLSGFRRFFRLSAFRPDPPDDVAAELDFHFRETQREFEEAGMSPAEARAEATRRFGDVHRYRRRLESMDRKEAARTRRVERLSGLSRDISYALRGLRRSPTFSLGVIFTLALGIGANATILGVVDRILLTPPAHVQDPGQVVRLNVYRTSPFTGEPATLSYQTYNDYRDFLEAGSSRPWIRGFVSRTSGPCRIWWIPSSAPGGWEPPCSPSSGSWPCWWPAWGSVRCWPSTSAVG